MLRVISNFLIPKNVRSLPVLGSRWYSASSAKEIDRTDKNPFLKKYSDKIASFQDTSLEEFESRIRNMKTKPKPASKTHQKMLDSASDAKVQSTFTNTLHTKTLDSFMKLELLQDKSAEEIESIWKLYHKDKLGIYAVLPSDRYSNIVEKQEQYPTFLFPLPRVEGYEFIVSQLTGNSCHFTPLLSFKAYKENAPVCFTLTYFSELKETKNIVLLRGEFDEKVLRSHEAQCLANYLHLYYGEDNVKRDRLLWTFNKRPDSFKHMDLVSELEFGMR